MSDTPSVSLVCCDLASVAFDSSIVERAFAEAIATQGIVTGTEAYVRSMVKFDRALGCPPADVMRGLFGEDEPRALAASLAFERSFRAAADRYGIMPPGDTAAVFGKLREAHVKVCLLSGFSRSCSAAVLDRLGWAGRIADLVLCADDAPRGFPWPDQVLTAVIRLGIDDVREVALVSAAESGLQSGLRAGAQLIAGMRTASRTTAALRRAGATHIIDDVAALPGLLAPDQKGNAAPEPELHRL
jgi:phosphoglycolate phosphatase